MEEKDSYKTITAKSDIELKVKGSIFIGHARPCLGEQEAEDRITTIKKKYHDATHNCFAYRLGLTETKKVRFSDDGEPSGTAGKPILDNIEGHDLTNTLIVVTRYFGGTKLGTGGLSRAYSEAAAEALKAAGIVEKYITATIFITVEFHDYNLVERIIRALEGNIVGAEFTEKVSIKAEIRTSMAKRLKDDIIEATSGRALVA